MHSVSVSSKDLKVVTGTPIEKLRRVSVRVPVPQHNIKGVSF